MDEKKLVFYPELPNTREFSLHIVGILGVKEGLGRELFPLPSSPSFSPLVVSGLVVLPSPVYGGKRSYRELNSN